MKILRLQVPHGFLNSQGLSDIFEDVDQLEILTTYQYDKNNFFSMQRIVIKEGIIENFSRDELKNYIKEKFYAYYLVISEVSKNSIVCTMRQRRDQGFWGPLLLDAGAWALTFPLNVDKDYLLINILCADEEVDRIKKMLGKIVGESGFKVLAQSTSISSRGLITMPVPDFSPRQQEIASYAARKGFFESPKKISAKELAEKFGISVSAVNENIRKAETLAMKFYFGAQSSFKNK
ncbi:MAG: winged helix-turn-helix transcriptional regulator [archaeon]|nr:winged helix-turn-helix transcriptional regulator [archaeon]